MYKIHSIVRIFFYVTALISGIVLFVGCEKSEDTIWLYYTETYCSDPWGEIGTTEEERKQKIAQYLATEGIYVLQIEITDEGDVQFCYACHCTTGKLIKCEVREKDADEMQVLGFYK